MIATEDAAGRASEPGDNHVVFVEGTDLRLAGGFTQIPNCILRSPTLSNGAKVLYGVLLSYAWQDGWCHPTQETVAADAGCGEREVRNNLAELSRKGLIRIVRQGLQKPNVYQILAVPPSFGEPANPWARSDRQKIAGPDRHACAAPERQKIAANEDSVHEDSISKSKPRAPAREEPPAPAGPAPDAGGPALPAAPGAASCALDRTGTLDIPAIPRAGAAPEGVIPPRRAIIEADLGAVCARYAQITGRTDLTPEQIQMAIGEAATDHRYVQRTLDWLQGRMDAGCVHNPRGLFLQGLINAWADENPSHPAPGVAHPVTRRTHGGSAQPTGAAAPAGGQAPAAAPGGSDAQNTASAKDLHLVAGMVGVGVTERVAADLERSDAEECERQLRWLAHRHAKDPAAALVRAVRERWGEPPAVAEERHAEAERERTRKLFAEWDEAERAAQDPEVHARGLAAIAEIKAMFAHKCGGAADPSSNGQPADGTASDQPREPVAGVPGETPSDSQPEPVSHAHPSVNPVVTEPARAGVVPDVHELTCEVPPAPRRQPAPPVRRLGEVAAAYLAATVAAQRVPPTPPVRAGPTP